LTWAAGIAGCHASLIVDFSASINPLGPPASAIAAITGGLKDLSHYPDPDYSQLRHGLSQWHGLSPEWLLPGNGSAELLTWASWELSGLEETYLLTPAFADYRRAFSTFGVKIQPLPLNPTEPDSPLPLKGSNRPAGILLNNPHNPTGKLFSREEILPYLEEFSLVVVDEAFMDFVPPPEQQSLIPMVWKYPNLVVLRSLTKFYSLAGLRLGYAISNPRRLQLWQKWRDPWPVNVLAAAAGEAVIQDRGFQEQTWQWLCPARKALFNALQSIQGLQPLPSSANFLLVGTGVPSGRLQQLLLKNHRIFVRDCSNFPELGDRYFRVAVRTQTENQNLIQAITKVLSS
jgi:L-threonine-O-3-phosphate decarboxylase